MIFWRIIRPPLQPPTSTRSNMIFKLHIADSVATRMRGLGGTTHLAADEGLLLRFPFPFFWPIWMRAMRFPIDVLWLRRRKIVDLCEGLSPANQYRMHFPSYCADSCVELQMGAIQNHALSIGTPIEFQIVNLEI